MGQSFFSSSVVESGNMKPFAALTFVMGCAFGAPADLALNGVGYAGLGLAGVHGLGYAAAPAAVGVAAAAPAVAAAPVAYGAEHYSAGPVVPHAPVAYAEPAAPAPYTTATQGAGVTTVHQPAPVVTKQVHYGQTSYVSGYATKIHKQLPPIFLLLSQLSSRDPRLSMPLLSRPRLRSTMSRPQSMSRSLMMLLMTLLS